ncbi:MAG: hypothetical protein IRZ11_07840 [Clostridia bacterium]|nr:hypothetical protein [Clostridia bacterium]
MRRAAARLAPAALGAGRALERLGRRVGGGRREGAALVAAFALVVALAALALVSGPPGRPRLAPPAAARPLIVGYFENGWSRVFDDSFPSLRAHYDLIDEIFANWYSVGGAGEIARDESRAEVFRFTTSHGVRMGILVTNVGGATGDREGMLRDPAARARAVGNLADLVRRAGYEAVDVDFELLAPSANVGLTQFVCGLRRALPKGVELSAAVFPPVGVAREINGAYDYPALADCTDFLVVMLYDYHFTGGPPGPLSPAGWVRENVAWFPAHGVPGRKVVVAAGLYGIDWDLSGQTGAEERPLDGILGLASDLGLRGRWDRASQNPYYRYTDDRGRRHVVWYQDWRTLSQRVALVKAEGLRGVALWRLGFGVPRVWSALRAAVGTR